MNTYRCDGCHQMQTARYAELHDGDRRWLCSRACLMAWLAAHPDGAQAEGPE